MRNPGFNASELRPVLSDLHGACSSFTNTPRRMPRGVRASKVLPAPSLGPGPGLDHRLLITSGLVSGTGMRDPGHVENSVPGVSNDTLVMHSSSKGSCIDVDEVMPVLLSFDTRSKGIEYHLAGLNMQSSCLESAEACGGRLIAPSIVHSGLEHEVHQLMQHVRMLGLKLADTVCERDVAMESCKLLQLTLEREESRNKVTRSEVIAARHRLEAGRQGLVDVRHDQSAKMVISAESIAKGLCVLHLKSTLQRSRIAKDDEIAEYSRKISDGQLLVAELREKLIKRSVTNEELRRKHVAGANQELVPLLQDGSPLH